MESWPLTAVIPHKGIAAGCSWATVWVQVYSIPPLRVWQDHHPIVELGLFIDDFMGATTAEQEHQVVGRLTSSATELRLAIEEGLECQVAGHKSTLLASSDRLLHKLRIAFGRFAGSAQRSASNLGVDFFLGRRRACRTSSVALRARHGKFLKRFRRLHALKRQGYDMRQMFVTGLQQFSTYGAEVVGFDHKQLQKARAAYLQLVGSPARSSSSALALAVLGDPLWRQALGPALTWATISWKAATSPAYQGYIDVPRLGQLAAPVISSFT